MEKQDDQHEYYDHKLPFHVHILMPRFSYHPHDGLTKIVFALIVGLLLGGFIFIGYLLLV